MKVLYFHQYFSTPKGSSGMRSYEFAKALGNRGHEVTIVCGRYDGSKTGLEEIPFKDGKREGVVEGIRVVELFLNYSNKLSFIQRTRIFLLYALRSIRIALTYKYDVLFATTTPLTAALPGIAARWLRNKKFVFEVRDLWPELPAAMGVIKNPIILKLMKLLEVTAYRSAHRLIGLSPGIVSGITKYKIPEKNVFMIPNGCDSDLFKPLEPQEKKIDHIQSNEFVAIFSGTMGIANGVDAILNAAYELKKAGREDIKLLMVGSGRCKDDLKNRAKKESLTSCIFMDPVPKVQIARLTGSCDTGLMVLANIPAFYYGTSPNKFFDYISCGIPVINNYPGWIAEMIEEYQCGIAVKPEMPEDFALALCTLADNPQRTKNMGLQSQKLAQNFLRSNLAQQFCNVLEEFRKDR
jgi:glycosyltransferase involved in cell wall biosynthesis